MKFIKSNHYISGIGIPLNAINSSENLGCGEFADLTALAKWCAKAGITIIQILPVYDTGLNPSPYSAISGFALNPIYIKIGDIEYGKEWNDQIAIFKESKRKCNFVEYKDTYGFKMDILNKIYDIHRYEIIRRPDLQEWMDNCEWINVYSAFKILAEINGAIVWSKWSYDPVFNENYDVRRQQLREFLNHNKDRFYFYSWIQFLLEKQLRHAAETMGQLGVNLKGDLPILIDKESCDVWFHRDLFDMNRVAGAPPDDFSKEGQNWGFPVYNLDAMEKDDYRWWKQRIAGLNKFYHAIRLDHIIGFMRLWQFPSKEPGAMTGFFSPSDFITALKIIGKNIGIDEIENLSRPAINEYQLASITTEKVIENLQKKYLEYSPTEHVYYLNDEVIGEIAINRFSEPDHIKELLKVIYRNRIFIKVSQGNYAPLWGFENTGRFQNLPHEKKDEIQNLVHEYYTDSEKVWYDRGKKFLSMLQKESDFLFCGEDLGAVPQLTSKLLEEQNILSLKVLRWTRNYNEPGSPFIDPANYPRRSVATTSVHDSENLRQWWRDDHIGRNSILQMMKAIKDTPELTPDFDSEIAPNLAPEFAIRLLKWFFNAASEIVILPFQDLFSIEEKYRIASMEEERVNVPGKVLDTNWVYKMPCTIESLEANEIFMKNVKSLTKIRSDK
jgi:4-alpha-glucanotransferase